MKSFLAKRLGLSVLTVGLAAIIVFFMTHVLPGDVARQSLGRQATPEDVAAFNKLYGLDQPILNQLFRWIKELLSGNLGVSMSTSRPVSVTLIPALGYSARLAAVAFVLIVPLSIAGGIVAAMNRGKKIDRAITVGGLSAAVIPEFVWAVVLLLLFGVVFRIFPISAMPDEGAGGFLQSIWHLILPSIALFLVLFGYIARITRAGVIEALDSDYMRTAVLKGYSRRKAVTNHVLRNAMLPILTSSVAVLPLLFLGSLISESFFGIPGLGSYTIDAINQQDFSVVRSMVFLGSVLYIAGLLLADISYTIADPRIRFE